MISLGIIQRNFRKKEGGLAEFEQTIRGVAELGFSVYEFCPEYIEHSPDALGQHRRREGLALAKSLGVKMIIHASFASVDICSIHKSMRTASLQQLHREIQLAHDLECDVITIHPGEFNGPASLYPKEYFRDIMKASYEQLLKFAEPLGVRICTENLPGGFMGTQEDLLRLFSDIEDDNFGLTFDIGHHNMIYRNLGLSERTAKAKEILQHFHEKIWVLHIHDNNGERDEHAALGTGQIQYDIIFPEVVKLGIEAYWILETSDRQEALESKIKLSELSRALGLNII